MKQSLTLLKSEARIATPIAKTLNGVEFKNMHLIIDVTAAAATPSVQVAIEGLDPLSGKFYELLAAIVAITATGTTVLRVGEDMEPVAGLAAKDMIPENFRITFTHADADSITYSASLNLDANG